MIVRGIRYYARSCLNRAHHVRPRQGRRRCYWRCHCAVDDENDYTRSGALEALAKTWPDDDTVEFLKTRSAEAPESRERGVACSALGRLHSRFGRIVITTDLDGIGPYLDPLEAIPRDQIDKAARAAGVRPDEIEGQVRSLSEHLGWDITKGAKAAQKSRRLSS